MVQLLIGLLLTLSAHARMDRFHQAANLGEKTVEGYYERYYPVVTQDVYKGWLGFKDDVFFQDYFAPYLFHQGPDYERFVRSELTTGGTCSNEALSSHVSDIRYAYRLITLSYLLEGQWHMEALSRQFNLKNGCQFDLTAWARTCRAGSPEMKTFLSRLGSFQRPYREEFPKGYNLADWLKEFSRGKYQWYSQYRLEGECLDCSGPQLEKKLARACEENRTLMDLVCGEKDDVHGLSDHRDAYFLIGRSNIINTFNQSGEAMACLRRYAEVFAHKEVDYKGLKNLFPPIHSFLRVRHGERYLQGRAYFYGSGKEFDQKGLTDIYVKEQPLPVEKAEKEPVEPPKKEVKPAVVVVPVPKVEPKPEPKPEPAPQVVEIKKPIKSAFLQAAELRSSSDLDRVEVDMLKLKYDYVFTLHLMNSLSEKLKTFMGQEALKEMVTFDKLGSKQGAVPLLFIKFMIDMEEHQGLWNLVNVVGGKFYVSNEIDAAFTPAPEYVELVNSAETNYQWQLFVLKPY